MTPVNLKELHRAINAAFTCPTCGKSTLVRATGHRARVVAEGEYYEATGFEPVTPETHCTCPGGPVDQLRRAQEKK